MKKLLLISLISITSILSFAQWTQIGPTIQNFSQNASLTVIGSTPYMAFTDVSNGGKLFVETFNGTDWVPVGGEVTSSFVTQVSLESDNMGDLYISYAKTTGGVNVKKLINGAWTLVGAEDFSSAFNLDFTIDDAGELYVAYSDMNNFGQLTVEKFENGTWSLLGSAAVSSAGIEFASIKVDNNIPYVAFRDFGAGQGATVMKYDIGSNSWSIVGNAGFSNGPAQFTSLVFNNGSPYVAFKEKDTDNKASVMTYNSSNDNWEYVGNAGISDGIVGSVSLTFNAGMPIIAYNDDANSDLTTAMQYNGSMWQKVGDSFGTGSTNTQNITVSGTFAYCGFIDQTSNVVLYNFDLGAVDCSVVGLNVNGQNIDCFGASTGSATANATNASAPISYSWSNGGNSMTISNLSAGTYSVTITDGNDCVVTDEITLTQAPQLNGMITNLGHADCSTQNGGFATVEGSGGTPGYSYNWSTGGNTMTEIDLSTGIYPVTITDSKGCQEIVSVTILGNVDKDPPTVLTQNLTVNLDENGTAVISPGMVDNGSSDNCEITNISIDISQFDCSHLGDNTITLTVTDGGGNSSTGTAVITVLDPVAPVITCPDDILSNSCNAPINYPMPTTEDACGGVVLTQMQGIPSGSNFPMGATIIEFMAEDLSGNQSDCSFTVTVENDIVLTANATDICFGATSGAAIANVTGGTAPYSYQWDDPNMQTTQTAENLSAGNYSVTITDINGCEATDETTLAQLPQLNGMITDSGNADCGSGGFATVEASGGSPGYSYNWSTGGDTMTETNLSAGTYSVTITDTKGCEEVVPVTIMGVNDTEPPMVITQDLTTALDASGSVVIFPEMVDNGSSDDCEISNISLDISQFDCSHLGNNTVILSVTDGAGNVSTGTAIVTVLDVIDPIITCPDDLLSNFCTAPIDYPMPTTEDACGGVALTQVQGIPSGSNFPMGPTLITFIAIDLSGNQSDCSFTVTVENDLMLTTEADDICFGTTGSAIANVTGGTTPYSYQWDDPSMQTTQIAENLSGGNYNVIITDDKGCIIAGMAEVNESTEIQISIDEVIDETGQNMDGAISITASGGSNSGYTYDWSLNGNPFETLEDLTNLDDGEYCVTVTDENGCTATTCQTVDFINNTLNPQLGEYIFVFPNPTSEYLNIRLDLPNQSVTKIDLLDALGRNILSQNESVLIKETLNINLSKFNSGVYFLKISVGEEYLIKRIIVE